MDLIAEYVEVLIGFFDKIGETFSGLVTGQVPVLIGMLTLVQFLIGLMGEKTIENIAKVLGNNIFLKYTIFPAFSMFFLGNPASSTLGKFLKERDKPGFYGAKVAVSHPLTSLFPHVNPAELFIWLGVSQGIEELGLSTGALAIRYIITGIIVGTLVGTTTEIIFRNLSKKNNYKID